MDRATVDHLLTTTRTVRRRLDLGRPVEPEVIQECLELAIQAPNGGNQNRYHFVVVTDPAKRAAIGAIYKKVFYQEHVPLSGAGTQACPYTRSARKIYKTPPAISLTTWVRCPYTLSRASRAGLRTREPFGKQPGMAAFCRRRGR